MIVFWKQKLVFLAVPKTGTSAYEAALAPYASTLVTNPPELKHAPLYRYNRFYRPVYEKLLNTELEVMAVIREPISWLGSWYRYRQRPFTKGQTNSTHDISFDDFVQAYLMGQRPDFANVGSQAKFIEPQPNGQHVHHLFKYENQARLIGFLEDRLQIKLDLNRENESPPQPLELSAKTEEKLRRKCADEFELWESIQ